MVKLLTILVALFFANELLYAQLQPNIIFIFTDDHGFNDLESHDKFDEVQMPNVESMVENGVNCSAAYVTAPQCTPSRAGLITGQYQQNFGLNSNKDLPLNPNILTIPDRLSKLGYITGMVGKWHLGYEEPNLPNDRGFTFFHGFLGDMMDDYWTHLRGGVNWMRLNKKTITPKGHATEIFSRWAIEYLRKQAKDKTKPFFLYLAYNAPHFPIQPPEDWLRKVQKREPQLDLKRATNVAFVEHMDHEIGKVLDAVEELGIARDTLITFSSDNGGSVPHAATNEPWRGGKQEHWEGGIRVPTCAVWPGTIPVGQSDELGITMDLLPTFAEIAGVPVENEIEGKSLVPIWLQGKKGDPERTLIWIRREGNFRYQGRAYYAIREGEWKLLQNHPFEPMQLVNLSKDPAEQNPLPSTHPMARKLIGKLMLHLQKSGNVPWQKPSGK